MVDGWIKCKRCGEGVHESHPHYIDDRGCYCWHCAFIENKLSEKDFLKHCGIYLNKLHAAVNPDGIISYWIGDKVAPWKRPDKEQRQTVEYAEWRKEVFERDDYTCQDCNKRGGVLNAHHLKPFKKFKRLRYKVDNGITLCEPCHRERHRKGGTRG